jgi:hypothetical protein
MHCFKNRLDDILDVSVHVAVPETKHTKAGRPQEIVAALVVHQPVDMLAAVQFDDDSAVERNEVANIEPDLVLASEFESSQLASSQATPEQAFGFREVSSEFADTSAHPPTKAFSVG